MESGGYELGSEGTARQFAVSEAKGKAEALLTVLRARGLTVSGTVERQVRDCTDLGRLDRWLERAVVVRFAEDLFD